MRVQLCTTLLHLLKVVFTFAVLVLCCILQWWKWQDEFPPFVAAVHTVMRNSGMCSKICNIMIMHSSPLSSLLFCTEQLSSLTSPPNITLPRGTPSWSLSSCIFHLYWSLCNKSITEPVSGGLRVPALFMNPRCPIRPQPRDFSVTATSIPLTGSLVGGGVFIEHAL